MANITKTKFRLSINGKQKDITSWQKEFKELLIEKDKLEKQKQADLTAFKELDELIHRELEKQLRNNLIKQIVTSWKNSVVNDYDTNNFTEQELEKVSEKYRAEFENGKNVNKAYGTSLIAAAITSWYWFGFHIGDGRFTVLYKNGEGDQPVPWDSRCYLNVTTSICDDDILDRGEEGVRAYFSLHTEKAPPVAFFLCSDGVDDNFPVDGNEKHLYSLYRTVGVTFAKEGYESTCGQIKELAEGYATKGKGDDTSLAGIVNIEELKEVADEWIKKREAEDAEKEKAKAAAKEKAEAERKAAEEAAAMKEAKRAERETEAAAAEKAAVEKAAAEKAEKAAQEAVTEAKTAAVEKAAKEEQEAARTAAAAYKKQMDS